MGLPIFGIPRSDDLKRRFRLTPRRALTIGAVFIIAGIGAFVMLDLVFADRMTPARATSLLQKSSPELTAVLQQDFSSDFKRIVKATVKSEKKLTVGESMAKFLDDQTRPITERFSGDARQAPPALVAAWMGKLSATMKAVENVAGPASCSEYIEKGTSALTDPDVLAKLTPVFDARDAAFFAALAGARDTPASEAIGPATDADWSAVEAAMNGLEVPAGYAEIVKRDDTKSPDYCAALSYYFRTLSELPGGAGDRIRAEYFVNSFS